MTRQILWIEDDFFEIKGLFFQLEKAGYTIDSATSAAEGYDKAKNWQNYCLIAVDIILPLSDDADQPPGKVQSWRNEPYVGIGLLKWLLAELKVEVPVIALSVIRDPVENFGLQDLGIAVCLSKRGLLPSKVKEEVFRLLRLGSEPATS